MTEGGPVNRAGLVSSLFDIVRGLTIQNLLSLGILCAIAVPAYFAWQFMSDPSFRREFMSTTRIINAQVPCLVVQGNVEGGGDRITITTAYEVEGRMEHHVSFRSAGLLTDSEIKEACDGVHKHTTILRQALWDQRPQEKK